MTKEEMLEMGVPEAAAERIAAVMGEELRAARRARLEAAAEIALLEAGARNRKAARALLDLEGAEMTEGGEVKGLKEQIEALKSAEDSAFLFSGRETAVFRGVAPAQSGLEWEDGKADPASMSYDELRSYLDTHPGAALL